ncbi:MAG: peptide deformylase [Oscillospiraceae bacterium]|nr:peptide deformylase [Oscillospiraceae bacterium]
MALREIREQGDPVLSKVSREVTEFNGRLHQLLDDMHDTVREANGAGLAAPQVGVLRRVVIAIGDDGQFVELINPVIKLQEGEQDGPEGCLSVPGVYGMVKRPDHVTVEAVDRYGKPFTVEGHGLSARAFCHETEHLDGHLFTERVTKILTDEELAAYYGGQDSE